MYPSGRQPAIFRPTSGTSSKKGFTPNSWRSWKRCWRDGNFSHIAREHPEANIDMPFLIGTIPNVKRLADAFRAARRPVVYLAHVLKPDYSDAAFPCWRLRMEPGGGNRTHCVEGTWGAQIIDDLKPPEGEHLVVKKGFGGFSNTPLDTILRNMGVTPASLAG
jgi:nicotinamidase-related amidase